MPEKEPGRGDPMEVLDWLEILPLEPVASSDGLGWVGLQAGRYRASPAFELEQPALTHHMLVLFARPEVAAHAGFSDQSQFSHHFKRIVGVTPGQFRTRVRIA